MTPTQSQIMARLMSSPQYLSPLHATALLLDSPCETRADVVEPRSAIREHCVGGEWQPYETWRGIAVVTGSGTLQKRCGWWGLDYDAVTSAVHQAVEDPGVQTVVLNLASPGGSVVGCAETANRLAALAQRKPIVGFVDTMACSAMYWNLCALPIVATPSAQVGSIGVILMLETFEAMLEAMGIKTHVYKSGALKDMGAPWREPTEQEAAAFQADVDTLGDAFRSYVTTHRPTVQHADMQGQAFAAADALHKGLVDGLVNDLSDLLANLAGAAAH